MLERIDKINKNKGIEAIKKCENISSQVDVKNARLKNERYSNATYQAQIDKMETDIIKIRKEINQKQIESEKLSKYVELERINENAIKERVNQIHSKAKKVERVRIYL